MSDVRDWLDREVKTLQTLRDELRVQVHLGAAEIKEGWEHLERDWQHLEGKLRMLRRESREPVDEIGKAARELVEKIRDGYHQLGKLI